MPKFSGHPFNEEQILTDTVEFFERDPSSPSPLEEILSTREATSSDSLENGNTNIVVFVKLRDDGAGIFKPAGGEINLRERVRCGTYFKRERAAYLLDKFLGFDLVPETVIRTLNGQQGSMQRFIPDAKSGYETSGEVLQRNQQQLRKLWMFDYVLWNSDRHDGNLLFDGQEKLHAIDNGLSFGHDALRTYHSWTHTTLRDWEFPTGAVEQVQKLAASPEMQRILLDLLTELIPAAEAEACLSRIRKLATALREKPSDVAPDDWKKNY